jgi:NDP-sugar pyrophosphorylase family protein
MKFMLTVTDLFDLTYTRAAAHLLRCRYPWDALHDLDKMLLTLGKHLPAAEFDTLADGVWIHRSARIAPSACICAPCIIDRGCEVRHNAYIRGSVLIGQECVIGNASELKNAILFDGVQVPHYNYVGDSILGARAHMGAGSILANVKGDRSPVTVHCGDEAINTGRKKLGAMLGDGAEIGCGCVLQPGAMIGKGARVYPLSSVRGTLPPYTLLKQDGTCVPLQ